MGFTSSIGRFVGMGMIFLVAAGVNYFGSIGTPIALTSIAIFLGLFFPALRYGDAGPEAADVIVNAVYHRLIRLGRDRQSAS